MNTAMIIIVYKMQLIYQHVYIIQSYRYPASQLPTLFTNISMHWNISILAHGYLN